MKPKLCRFVLAGLLCCFGVSCTTAYDGYGYPRQVVEPGVAVAGAAAVGLLAYGLANNNHHRHYRHHGYHGSHHRGYDRGCYGGGGYHHGGYYRRSYGGHYGYGY